MLSTAKVSLAEVFHPWVRWEGPGSGFDSLSAGRSGNFGLFKTICLWESDKWDPDKYKMFQNPIHLREFEKWDPDMVSALEISKIACSVHSEWARAKKKIRPRDVPKDAERHSIIL